VITNPAICPLVASNVVISDGPSAHSIIADTGSTAHFGTTALPVVNKHIATTPLAIYNPNGSVMYSSHVAELDLPDLPPAARQVHIVPALASHTLISIGQFCDAGCEVTFSASHATVTYKHRCILLGTRNPITNLWHFDMPTPPPMPPPYEPLPAANGSTTTSECVLVPCEYVLAAIGSATPAECVAFAHASLFSPALSTLATALQKGYINNFPGLSLATLKKHPPQSTAMVKGHLDQTRKNVGSTKNKPLPADDTNDFPLSSLTRVVIFVTPL
jgi:hypothetical protein